MSLRYSNPYFVIEYMDRYFFKTHKIIRMGIEDNISFIIDKKVCKPKAECRAHGYIFLAQTASGK